MGDLKGNSETRNRRHLLEMRHLREQGKVEGSNIGDRVRPESLAKKVVNNKEKITSEVLPSIKKWSDLQQLSNIIGDRLNTGGRGVKSKVGRKVTRLQHVKGVIDVRELRYKLKHKRLKRIPKQFLSKRPVGRRILKEVINKTLSRERRALRQWLKAYIGLRGKKLGRTFRRFLKKSRRLLNSRARKQSRCYNLKRYLAKSTVKRDAIRTWYINNGFSRTLKAVSDVFRFKPKLLEFLHESAVAGVFDYNLQLTVRKILKQEWYSVIAKDFIRYREVVVPFYKQEYKEDIWTYTHIRSGVYWAKFTGMARLRDDYWASASVRRRVPTMRVNKLVRRSWVVNTATKWVVDEKVREVIDIRRNKKGGITYVRVRYTQTKLLVCSICRKKHNIEQDIVNCLLWLVKERKRGGIRYTRFHKETYLKHLYNFIKYKRYTGEKLIKKELIYLIHYCQSK
jgi:hypothetical protein